MPGSGTNDWDYVIVGSGAGGGTLAARLAEAGMRVLLIEAGGDPRRGDRRLPDDYDVPAFHAFASDSTSERRGAQPCAAWSASLEHMNAGATIWSYCFASS